LKEVGYDWWLVVEYAGVVRGIEIGMMESKEYIQKTSREPVMKFKENCG